MLITRLAQLHGDRLTETDRRIVSAMRERPHEAAFARAVDLTQPLGLHESAATRLAQRLGFEGFPQLREALRADYLGGDGPSQRVRNRIERTDAASDHLTAFLAEEIESLRAISMHVTQADLDATARELLDARRIHIYGQGNAVVLVEQIARRLTRFGLDVVILTGSRRDIAERAAVLAADDLLLALAFRRAPAMLLPLLALAADAGARAVLLTDTLVSLSPQPHRTLAAPRGASHDFHTLTVPMAISNALVLAIARFAPERTSRSLDRVELLLERLDT
ncbi:MurR/RpiR family transcriptional regulator [Agrococcus sp. Marseille-P2731]|uniref:MurR/RpiR family transcriptional regulator n=1 Tax=Agrococcus sp. Marseille-P2731 TaxID=1841862 RepID=UPI0009310D52|nr:MurR/RpiR family transcriptional regulator [Agrococcus sp. Marseille-P2731]